jgi:hypothetical protein
MLAVADSQGLGTQTRCRDADVWSLQGGGAHARRRSKTFEDGDEGTYVGDVWEIMASVLGAGLLGVERSGRPDQGREINRERLRTFGSGREEQDQIVKEQGTNQ